MNSTDICRQWLIEAGLAEESADRLALQLENVQSPEWMQDLSLRELFSMAFGEEIDLENDSENEDEINE